MSWGKPKRILGVYAIKLHVYGKETVYVGYSQNIKKRWRHHRYALNKGTHHNSLLQKAWDEHNRRSFKFFILKKCKSVEDALKLEKVYADFYGYGDPERCFNIGEPGNIFAPRNTLIGGVCYA